jgi:hypothetical protein
MCYLPKNRSFLKAHVQNFTSTISEPTKNINSLKISAKAEEKKEEIKSAVQQQQPPRFTPVKN